MFRALLQCVPLTFLACCQGGAEPVVTRGGGASAGAGGGAGNLSGAGSGGTGVFFGEVEIPGLEPSACATPVAQGEFGLSSGTELSVPGPYVVLTGTLPPDIAGSPVSAVSVQGSTRGVRLAAERGLWSYFLAAPGGDFSVAATAESAASAEPLSAHVEVGSASLPSRDIADQHSVGTWMFSWFTGDDSWECGSPWRPPGGFASWDGSAAWAREQLLDQLDAHIDLVGLQLDTPSGAGDEGYRFDNVVRVLEAARGLLDEGVLPPRLFPFLDTAVIAGHYQTSEGSPLELSTEAGRAYFYEHASAFYTAAQATFGSALLASGVARFHEGRPAVAAWHSQALLGADDGAVVDFKARFTADFGGDCYFIAHPNDWSDFAAVDEITQMLGPPSHFAKTGHDAAGLPTINLTPGFWNPLSSDFYLPREGGTHFEQAWQSALAERAGARHLWIDTWNETGEGSGMFAADPVSYAADNAGPCDEFVNLHDEAWSAESRHYIDVTRAQASAWNNEPDLDASPIASDVPETMEPGEQRYVTVVMRNTGDATWTAENHKLGLTFSAAARDFHLEALGTLQSDQLVKRFGGVARGLPGVFTVLLTAPCTPGVQRVAFEVYDAKAGGFGSQLQRDVTVAP